MSITLPPGFKFVPSDAELIGFYLSNKLNNLALFCDVIHDCDLYGTQEPWQIWKLYGGPKLGNKDLYFFTPLKKKSNKGLRICRRVGSGTWQGEDGAKDIKDEETHLKIGSKKRFRYENKDSEHNGGWIMHEYSLLGHDEFVVCRIRKKEDDKEAVGKKRKRRSNSKEGEVQKHPSKCSRVVGKCPVLSQSQSFNANESEPQYESEAPPTPPELLGEEISPDITYDDYSTFLENLIGFEPEPQFECEAPPELLTLGVGEELHSEITDYYSASIDELFPGENFSDFLLYQS